MLLTIIVLVRSAAVDSSGREFNRNRLIALMSAIVLEEVNSSNSSGIDVFILNLTCLCFSF